MNDETAPEGYTFVRTLAYRGKMGCESVICTRMSREWGPDVSCYGWHCATCDAPCSYQGHNCPALSPLSQREGDK